jgi:hypothetical protein
MWRVVESCTYAWLVKGPVTSDGSPAPGEPAEAGSNRGATGATDRRRPGAAAVHGAAAVVVHPAEGPEGVPSGEAITGVSPHRPVRHRRAKEPGQRTGASITLRP